MLSKIMIGRNLFRPCSVRFGEEFAAYASGRRAQARLRRGMAERPAMNGASIPGGGDVDDGLSRTQSVDDAVASLFPDAPIFQSGDDVSAGPPPTAATPQGGLAVGRSSSSGNGIPAFTPAVHHPHLRPGVAAAASMMSAPVLNELAGSMAVHVVQQPGPIAHLGPGGAHFPLDASAELSSSGSRALLNPLSVAASMTAQIVAAVTPRPAAAASPMALPHGAPPRTSSSGGYSAVLSGEAHMPGMPMGPSIPGLAIPSANNTPPLGRTASSGGFARAASGEFSRVSSGGFSRVSSCVPSRTSSAGGSMSGFSDVGEGVESTGDGAGTGEKRGKGIAPKRRPWSAEEHMRFLESLKRFGQKDRPENNGRVTVGLGPGVAELISVVVGTRTVSQVRSHAQKYFLQRSRTAAASSATSANSQTGASQSAYAAAQGAVQNVGAAVGQVEGNERVRENTGGEAQTHQVKVESDAPGQRWSPSHVKVESDASGQR